MARKKNFAIIGASSFSLSILKTLVDKYQKVTVFDANAEKLELSLSEYETVESVILNATNKTSLKNNGITQYDQVIIGLGSNIEASIMTILNLHDLGCTNIIVEAKDENHKRILLALGLKENKVIVPDAISGKIIGIRSIFNIDADIDVQSTDGDFISSTLVVMNPDVFEKTLQEVGLIGSKDFNIIQIKRKGKIIIPEPFTVLREQDNIVIFARIAVINNIALKVQGEFSEEDDFLKEAHIK